MALYGAYPYSTGTFPRRKADQVPGLRPAASLWSVASLDSGLSKRWPDGPATDAPGNHMHGAHMPWGGVAASQMHGLDQIHLLHPQEDFWKKALKRSKSIHVPSLERDTLRRSKSMAWNGALGYKESRKEAKASMDKRILATCLASQPSNRSQSVPNLHDKLVEHKRVLFVLEMLYNMYALG